jgi:membrane protein DedA with SNARE-associated domain
VWLRQQGLQTVVLQRFLAGFLVLCSMSAEEA